VTDSFSVVLAPQAVADLAGVPFPFRRQINQRFYKLKREPRPPEALSLADGAYGLLLWSWMVVYDVDDTTRTVTILLIPPYP